MAKNIVILCDGTSNEISSDRTNILRLYGTLKKSEEQIVFYDPGVGTFGADDSFFKTTRKGVEVLGLATGWGLDTNVLEAYRFLVEHYDHGEKDKNGKRDSDRIYLFGFSRGAYTARVLAGFIHTVGLINPHNMNLLAYVYQAYKAISTKNEDKQDSSSDNVFNEIRLYQRTLDTTRPAISLLGLFDTVGSVIESGRRGFRIRSHAFTSTNRSVAAVRHALAIDERRTMFLHMPWIEGQKHRRKYWVKSSEINQDVSEVWFRGSHGDVGGGLPEEKSALAKITLDWMIKETKPLGILYNTATVNRIVLGKHNKDGEKAYVPPDPCAEVNDSMRGFWNVVEYIPRMKSNHAPTNRATFGGFFIPRKEHRIIPSGAKIHKSVFDYDKRDVMKEHPNIPDTYVKV